MVPGWASFAKQFDNKSKILYNFKPNSRDANWYRSAVCSERGIEESYVRYLVCVRLTWRICRPCIAPVQCHDCFGKERAPNLHERESWRHTQLAFDQGANNPAVNIVITTYKVAVFTTNSLLIQQERIKVN